MELIVINFIVWIFRRSAEIAIPVYFFLFSQSFTINFPKRSLHFIKFDCVDDLTNVPDKSFAMQTIAPMVMLL